MSSSKFSSVAKLVLVSFVAVLFFAGFSQLTRAAEIRYIDTTVEADEIVSDDLYLSGDEIEIAGSVNGDVIASGDRILVSGEVLGDLYAFGGDVLITGDVSRSVYSSAGSVKIEGNVGRSVYASGFNIEITKRGFVEEDVFVSGAQINIEGAVNDDVKAAGAQVEIDGVIGDDVDTAGANVTVDEDSVSGEVRKADDYSSQEEQMEETKRVFSRGLTFGKVVSSLLWFVGMYLVGVVFIKFVPVKTNSIVGNISGSWTDFISSLLIGAGLTIAGGVIIVMMVVTIIGTPLAILFAGLAGFLTLFGGLWGDMAVGQQILRMLDQKDEKLYRSLFVGRILKSVIRLIPYVGGIIGMLYGLVMLWAVIGAFAKMKWDMVRDACESTDDDKKKSKKKSKGKSGKKKKSKKKK